MTRLIPAFAAFMLSAAPAMADRVAVLVFDASGSMWNRVEGDLTRIEVARDVMGDYFGSRDATVPLSVIAYGHNRRGDCRDIEVVTPMGQGNAEALESRLRALMPRGMTPLTDSLAMARDQIPPSAEAADIILVTDGLENCEGDPCALAASLAAEGIDIRAHVVGFGLSAVEAEALSCITDQTGGMLFQTNSGAELAEALQQVSAAAPVVVPEPEPVPQAAFDIGDKAEAGFVYTITWRGDALPGSYLGFVPQGENRAPASSQFQVMQGSAGQLNNPVKRTAPQVPGFYDLIIRVPGGNIVARQTVEVVPPAMGFDPIGSVEPGSRVRFTFRGPEQLGERIVIADLDQPINEHQRHGWNNALSQKGAISLTVPSDPGEYELRYLNAAATEVMFSRRFGVGIPFEDADLTSSDDLAAQAAAATRGNAAQDEIAAVTATFRLPPDVPQSDVSWDAVPLDPDMSPEAWAPMDTGPVISGTFEPGNWRVTAYAPGEVTLSADVAIFPGQVNDFVIPIMRESDAETLTTTVTGPWQVVGVPPYQVQAGMEQLLTLDLSQVAPDASVTGTWTAAEMLAGPAAAGRSGDITSASLDAEGQLRVDFAIGDPVPEPFTLFATPFGIGYAGSLSMGGTGLRIAIWPQDYPLPELSELRAALHGPAPADFIDTMPPATLQQQSDPVQSAPAPADLVPIRLMTPFDIGSTAVQWSVLRTDIAVSDMAYVGNDLAQMVTMELEPGTYAVEGVNSAEQIFLSQTITVSRDGQNNFEIPRRTDTGLSTGQAEVFDDPVAFTCNEAAGCAFRHSESGISVTLPNNWSMTEPYFYETAGGARADAPTATFLTEEFGVVHSIDLNPRQRLAGDGPCTSVGRHALCHASNPGFAVEMALMVIEGSLQISDQPFPATMADDANQDSGSVTVEPDDGARFVNRGPYLAGAEVLVQINRGQDKRSADRVVVVASGTDNIPPDQGEWLDDFRASVMMPDAPGTYNLAVLDIETSSLRALTEIEVAASPVPELRYHNPNPAVRRPYGVSPHGRMALADRLAITGPDGAVVVEASLYEVITGKMRIPEGTSGPHALQYIADDGVLASAVLDVGGPPVLAPSGGSSGPAELTIEGEVTSGATVQVTVRGMIPERATVGFIRAGADDNTILQTGSSVSPGILTVDVKVPDGPGPWALRLIDQNLIRVAEILPEGTGNTAPPMGIPDEDQIVAGIMGQVAASAAAMQANVTEPVTTPGSDTVTGRIVVAVGDAPPLTLMTSSREIPAVTPPAGTDQAVLDFLQMMSGRVIHSASWTVVTGPIIVSLDAKETLTPGTPGLGIVVGFSLDETTLEILPQTASIEITPDTAAYLETFDLSDPVVEITGLQTSDGNSMAIAGRFTGMGPNGVAYSGTFDIDAVTGSSLLTDLLTGR